MRDVEPANGTQRHLRPNFKIILFQLLVLFFALVLGVLVFWNLKIQRQINEVAAKISHLETSETNFSQNFDESLYNDHLKILQSRALAQQIESLESEATQNTSLQGEAQQVTDIYNLYQIFLTKESRNQQAKLDLSFTEGTRTIWGEALLAKDFPLLKSQLDLAIKKLDEDYSKYVPTVAVNQGGSKEGGSSITVETERGKFSLQLVILPLSDYKIETVAANAADCTNDCPTKSLADYVKESGAYAAINGSYFCPPDYASCKDKVNSYDYAVYNSNKGVWLNNPALTWSETGLFTFNEGSYDFFEKSSDYSGSEVAGGISNYPSLVLDGEIVVGEEDLTSYQKDTKGNRGVLGGGEGNVYFAVVKNATVLDAAYAIKAAGGKKRPQFGWWGVIGPFC